MDLRIGVITGGCEARDAVEGWRRAGLLLEGAAGCVVAATDGAHCQGAETFEDAEDLIASPTVDAVDVAAPPALRAGILRSAMAAGKHIFCDPPLALALRDVEEIAALSGRCPGAKQAGGWMMRLPALSAGRAMIGTPIRMELTLEAAPADGSPCGPMETMGSPAALLVDWLCGEVAEALGTLEPIPPHGPIVEGVTALLKCTSGAVVVLAVRADPGASQPRLRLEATGTEGAIAFDLAAPDLIRYRRPHEAAWAQVPCVALDDAEAADLARGTARADFVRSIAAGSAPSPSFRDALRAHRVVDAIGASIDDGAWQPVEAGR